MASGAGGWLPAQSRGCLQDGAGAGGWLPVQSRGYLQDGAGAGGCIRKADVRRGRRVSADGWYDSGIRQKKRAARRSEPP